MKSALCFAALLFAVFMARRVDAHGTPIHVEVPGNKLTVSAGLTDADGFAPMIYVEDDDDGDPLTEATLPTVGPVIIWNVPGFDISGMNDQSDLSIELISRPVKDSTPTEHRVVWYWNPVTELVEPASEMTALSLLGLNNRSVTVDTGATTPPPPFLIADPIAGKQGFHNHSLLAYALDNDPTPPPGAYGFFARLTSSDYLPSDPFLVVLNHQTDYAQMFTAALAINAAAVDGLAGDFNMDGRVDAADYTAWRNGLGAAYTQDDYDVWKSHFGQTAGGAGIGATDAVIDATAVPEPHQLLLAAIATAIVLTALRAPQRDKLSPPHNALCSSAKNKRLAV